MSNTSHELRTPLNGIIGLAESLLDGAAGQVNEKLAVNLYMIASSGKRLANLVNDILDFSRLKNKSLELQTGPVDIRALTDVVFTLCRPLIGSKDLELVNAIHPELPPVEADENRLQQIMHNLVGNAIKFTEAGSVKVWAVVKDYVLAIHVADTGIGIPGDKLERIFESFEQSEGSADRTYGGTGLGLAVTRQLVELHGGLVWVESTLEKGSTFTFTLPISKKEIGASAVSEQAKSKVRIFEPTDSGAHKREDQTVNIEFPEENHFHIMVVDDDPVNRQVLANDLELQNYTVKEASSGNEALKALENGTPPDLILLDVMMPRMSGYEVCRKIRQKFPRHELPVIFLTAKNQPTDMVTAFNVGGNDFVSKPVSKAELLSRVQTHLRLLEINRNLEKKVEERTKKLKDSQSKLYQAEKMASLGTLLAGVAHGINNPTSIVNISSHNLANELADLKSFLEELVDSDEDVELIDDFAEKFGSLFNHLNTVKEGTNRISKIVKDLRTFSRMSDGEIKQVNLMEGLNVTINLVKAEYGKHIHFISHFQGDPVIMGNAAELNQAFMNIMVNACQSIRQKQQQSRKPVEARLEICSSVEDGQLVLRFEDTGAGMSEEVRRKMFDPFFTTKPVGEGTGLGLAIAFEIVRKHGGKIDVLTEEGKGAVVTISLPLKKNLDDKEDSS
jgi:signal transduction histidine kinase